MKRLNLIFTFFLAVFIFSCVGVKVTSDQGKDTDFTKYKTFSFLGWQDDTGTILNEFDKKRLHDAFKAEFSARNLQYMEEGGDMAISLFLVVDQKTSTTAYTNYYGGYGGRYGGRYGGGWGGGQSSTTYSESDYLVGTLVMDVFDEAADEQIWQGVAAGTINEKPEKREKSIPKVVNALMKKFPISPVE